MVYQGAATQFRLQTLYITFYRPDGSSISFSGYPGRVGAYTEQGGGGLATLTGNADGTYTLHDEDGTTQTYSADGALVSIKDESGIGWNVTTDSMGRPIKVTHTDGQFYTLAYTVDAETTLTETETVKVTGPGGNVYQFTETEFSNTAFPALGPYQLSSVTFPGYPATTITYQYTTSTPTADTVLLSGTAINGVPYSTGSYSDIKWANGTRLADGSNATSISYAFPTYTTMVATVTNALGQTTTMTYGSMYDGQYLLTSVSRNAVADCGATTQSMAYDANGNLTKTIDNDGIAHTYSYAANGQLQSETEASGTSMARTIDYAWDPDQQLTRLLSVTIPGESRTSYTYNAQNRLASVTRTNLKDVGTANQSLTTTYAYALYGNGMVETMTVTQPSPSGTDHTTYSYDTHGNLVSVTDGLGHVTSYSNYNGLGEVGKVVGPNGAETDYTYDARGRVASKTTHPNGTAAMWTYAYDGFGLLAKVTAPDGEITTWSRDAEKRVKTITHNDKDGTSTESFTYDANGDVTSDVVARGSDIGKAVYYVYDALGRIYQRKGANGQVLTYAYDGNGNVLSVSDALGHKTRYYYDALNRVIDVVNAAGGTTGYTYDAGNHVTYVTDPRGLVTGYSWDGLGQLWQVRSPDTGTTNYYYDAYGRRSSKYWADGSHLSYAYDAMNRLVSVAGGSATRTYTWDSCANGKGRLCVASSGTTAVYNTYTPEGWLAARAFSITSGPVYSIGYAYDALGQVTEVAYPDGNEALYDYSHGAVADVRLKVGASTVYGAASVDYRPMDMAMSSWTSYGGLSNTISYDNDLRPVAITVPGVESLGFAYDTDNRIIRITNGVHPEATQTLSYDAMNRLLSDTASEFSSSYSYDADGNRKSQKLDGVATSFTYASNSNWLLSSSGGTNATYGYNAEGDTKTISGHTAYTYDPFNRLAIADGESYLVSAQGQRLEKSGASGTTYFAPDAGGALLAEDQSGAWMDHVWLNGREVAVMAYGNVWPLHDDQTGRPLDLTNPSSHAVEWRVLGMPFNTALVGNSWGGNLNVGFPGQYYDSESGLWHNGYRDYNPDTGRYIESDPIGLAGGINTYVYVGNNPISNVDPLGLCNCSKPKGPNDPVLYETGNGVMFDAPAKANWSAVAAAGQANGMFNIIGIDHAIGHYGAFDFQRSGGKFNSDYTNSSNYAVGVFMENAGYPEWATIGIGDSFAHAYSSNAGSPAQSAWWRNGWSDAHNGTLAQPVASDCH